MKNTQKQLVSIQKTLEFHYSGTNLGAVKVQQFKRHLSAGHGGLPGKAFFDVFKDPKEEHGIMVSMLWARVPFDDIAKMQNETIKKYPHRKPYYSKMEEQVQALYEIGR